jgi:hypothetical protein
MYSPTSGKPSMPASIVTVVTGQLAGEVLVPLHPPKQPSVANVRTRRSGKRILCLRSSHTTMQEPVVCRTPCRSAAGAAGDRPLQRVRRPEGGLKAEVRSRHRTSNGLCLYQNCIRWFCNRCHRYRYPPHCDSGLFDHTIARTGSASRSHGCRSRNLSGSRCLLGIDSANSYPSIRDNRTGHR